MKYRGGKSGAGRRTNRREFLEIMAGVGVSIACSGSRFPTPGSRIDKVGLQLYTVRDLMKNDVEGTIAHVAEIGYKEVEFAGYFNKSPKEIRAMLDRLGL